VLLLARIWGGRLIGTPPYIIIVGWDPFGGVGVETASSGIMLAPFPDAGARRSQNAAQGWDFYSYEMGFCPPDTTRGGSLSDGNPAPTATEHPLIPYWQDSAHHNFESLINNLTQEMYRHMGLGCLPFLFTTFDNLSCRICTVSW